MASYDRPVAHSLLWDLSEGSCMDWWPTVYGGIHWPHHEWWATRLIAAALILLRQVAVQQPDKRITGYKSFELSVELRGRFGRLNLLK